MDRVVRAVGRMVVCVEAAADDKIIRNSSRVKNVPHPDDPKIALPWIENASPALAELPRPWPLAPMPAKACIAVTVMVYVISKMIVDRMAARPGVRFLSLVSSFTATAVSQPQ